MALYARAQEILAVADPDHDGGVRRPGGARPRAPRSRRSSTRCSSRPMRILGISAFYHDSAAALVEDGRIVAAAQEERFTRKKHDPSFPHHAIAYCLAEAGVPSRRARSRRVLRQAVSQIRTTAGNLHRASRRADFRSFQDGDPALAAGKTVSEKPAARRARGNLPTASMRGRLLFCEHHLSHAASAFFPSPFESAAVLTMDGVGEWATTSAAIGNGNRLEIFQEIHFPHSLGLLYSASHLLHRFQGQLRRIQGDGARALWRAEIRTAHSRQSDRPEAGRLVPARHVVFRLLHRLHHDQRSLRTSCSASRCAARINC